MPVRFARSPGDEHAVEIERSQPLCARIPADLIGAGRSRVHVSRIQPWRRFL